MSAALALTPAQQVVASWRAGVQSLRRDRQPAPGLLWYEPGRSGRDGVWLAVHNAMVAFLDDWGERAVEQGYTVEQLFGVHRLAGAIRADSTGALITNYPYRVVALSETEIVLERAATRLTIRGLTNPAEAIPLWEFPGARART